MCQCNCQCNCRNQKTRDIIRINYCIRQSLSFSITVGSDEIPVLRDVLDEIDVDPSYAITISGSSGFFSVFTRNGCWENIALSMTGHKKIIEALEEKVPEYGTRIRHKDMPKYLCRGRNRSHK